LAARDPPPPVVEHDENPRHDSAAMDANFRIGRSLLFMTQRIL